MKIKDIFNASKIKAENESLKAINEQLSQEMNTEIESLKTEIKNLKSDNEQLISKMDALGVTEYYQTKEKQDTLVKESNNQLIELNKQINNNNCIIADLNTKINDLTEISNKLSKQTATQERKLSRIKELYRSIDHAINNFFNSDVDYSNCRISKQDFDDMELISPSVILKLHCMDIQSLRKAYRENEKQINKILEKYSARYTTKANRSIYNLMVIALRAELQNILYNLKYEKLDKSIEDVQKVSAKYLKIAGEGNQSIAGTLTKFIGEIEYLFINAVKIEYNYYVKKEQARQEQLAIREQMRQEAEERKALEAEKKKVEKEELKYQTEITKLQETVSTTTDNDELAKLNARILELQSQLADVIIKKEEISNLQNGKAGNVYIISNLGSFGDDVFKIGMTRRLDPQERINELGSASVPFKFDVHSFIFSDDAVNLEKQLHDTLNSKRLNKVNLRKEFFKVSIDELEHLVTSIDSTAEFNKTMLAEEFRQSMSSDEVYNTDYSLGDEEDIDE